MFVIILFKISVIIVNGMIIIELFLFISIDYCTPLFISSIDLIERVCYKHR